LSVAPAADDDSGVAEGADHGEGGGGCGGDGGDDAE
jgi:hypothetical protein